MEDMTEIYKAEASALRKIAQRSAELFEKYGWMFEKDDQGKAIEIICLVRKTGHDVNSWNILVEKERLKNESRKMD